MVWVRLQSKGFFLCTNPLCIVIDTTEFYTPILLIKCSENKYKIGGFSQIAFMEIDMDSCENTRKVPSNCSC